MKIRDHMRQTARALLFGIVFAALLGQTAARGARDVVGTVHQVDPDTKILVVREDGTNRLVTVQVNGQTAIAAQGDQAILFDQLVEGARVAIQDEVRAASIKVEGELVGVVRSVDQANQRLEVSGSEGSNPVLFQLTPQTVIEAERVGPVPLRVVRPGDHVIVHSLNGTPSRVLIEDRPTTLLGEFWDNFRHNLFKPLLLFFYAGFLIPLLGVKFEMPYVMYQALTIYLLIAIGWHGGEELAMIEGGALRQALGLMGVGFLTNLTIGLLAYAILRAVAPRMRRIDTATVAGYYGSDSAGTFVTCLGVLTSLHLAYAPYMPVMLAVMEIPGCLVALTLVARLRKRGMDAEGNMPDEPDYNHPHLLDPESASRHEREVNAETEMALERTEHPEPEAPRRASPGLPSKELLREVFLNPGIFLIFAGVAIGFISRKQGTDVTSPDDRVFLDLFPGLLTLFLLEMGMTASRKLRDLKAAGPAFIAFGLIAPNLFALLGMSVMHTYSMVIGQPFELGSYALFAVLCGAASYIAVPAVQRLAIPEASPTLPLAASLGLTFSYNVTIGIPVYLMVARILIQTLPVV